MFLGGSHFRFAFCSLALTFPLSSPEFTSVFPLHLPLILCMRLPLCLPLHLPLCLSTCPSACFFGSLPLPAFLPASLPVSLQAPSMPVPPCIAFWLASSVINMIYLCWSFLHLNIEKMKMKLCQMDQWYMYTVVFVSLHLRLNMWIMSPWYIIYISTCLRIITLSYWLEAVFAPSRIWERLHVLIVSAARIKSKERLN